MNKQESYLSGLPPIKVVGVGGAGCNAVNRMIQEKIHGVEFLAINTDAQHLEHSLAKERMRLGDKITRGLGVGGNPDVGYRAADESRDELQEALRGYDMIFVTAGMGGGTGTGGAPVVAEVAKLAGALTIAIVTKPFAFEGAKRRQAAEAGVRRLQEFADTVIVIPNDRLLTHCGAEISVTEAFSTADDILRQGIAGIAEVITTPGEVNLDFNDVKKVMGDGGQAIMAIGRGRGENRAVDAAKEAIASPLLEIDITGAKKVLYNVTSSGNLGLSELNLAAKVIQEMVDPEAEIIFGTAIDPRQGDEVTITVIATGFLPPAVRQEVVERERWSQRVLQEIGLDGGDVELPAFLRRQRAPVQ